MGVTETGAIFKAFTFDGESSRDYGVYITGSAVFNAPERDVEMISIPGRDGAFAQDRGRFSNIEVTYPAGLFGFTEEDFAEGVSDLRNWLASKKGYVRLEDDYNPDEYRLAVYKSGLEVDLATLKSGEFSLTFDCKPQRYLKSGETAIEVEDGDTITNPTLFESRPMLEVDGYGAISLNGETVSIADTTIGRVQMAGQTTPPTDVATYYYQLANMDSLNNGDTITVKESFATRLLDFTKEVSSVSCTNPAIGTAKGIASANVGVVMQSAATFTAGTAAVIFYETGTLTVMFTDSTVETFAVSFDLSISTAGLVTMTASATGGSAYQSLMYATVGEIVGQSTKTALGSPLFFDLDIGEAYKEESGAIVAVNNAVTIPAKLPTLKPGANTVTFDNTVTQLKVVPRWWKV